MLNKVPKELSAASLVRNFLIKKGKGYEFTTETLVEDFNTDPEIGGYIDRSKASSAVSNIYKLEGALLRHKESGRGTTRHYTVSDPDAIRQIKDWPTRNEGPRGPRNRKEKYKFMPDTDAPTPTAPPGPIPTPSKEHAPHPGAILYAGMLKAIAEYVNYVANQEREKNKPITGYTTDELTAEIRRRLI